MFEYSNCFQWDTAHRSYPYYIPTPPKKGPYRKGQ